jgi:hypothetical protein
MQERNMIFENSSPSVLRLQGPRPNWPQRFMLALLGAALVVCGFFFIAVVLVAGSVLAIAIALRWWWIVRRLRAAQKAAAPLEGEYRVLEHDEVQKTRSKG